MGLLKVDDQLERRPVAILQTAHFGGQFQKKSAGGGSNPSAPTFVALTVRSIAFFIAAVGRYFVFLGKVSSTRIVVFFSSTQVGHLHKRHMFLNYAFEGRLGILCADRLLCFFLLSSWAQLLDL